MSTVRDEQQQQLFQEPVDRDFAVATHPALPGQIVARNVAIEVPAVTVNGSSKVMRASFGGGAQKFLIRCAPVKLNGVQTSSSVFANVILANGSLIAMGRIAEGDLLYVDSATLDRDDFLSLPTSIQHRILRFAEPDLRAWLSENQKYACFSTCEKLEIRRAGGMGETAFALANIPAGELLFRFICPEPHESSEASADNELVLPFPTMYTICVRDGHHMIPHRGSECLSHSCDPNAKVSIGDRDLPTGERKLCMDFVATKVIQQGDVVSWNYLTTEWDMDCPFDCMCGAATCFGRIAGFKHMHPEQQKRLYPDASPVIKATHDAFTAALTGETVHPSQTNKCQKHSEQQCAAIFS